MGNVRLYGATSGYTELAPPAVAGDNVLTLPAHGFGKVLQVVSATKVDAFSTTSTSFVDVTGLSVSITPSATSSTILVLMNASAAHGTNDTNNTRARLMRDSTPICLNSDGRTFTHYGTLSDYDPMTYSVVFQDSPATISSTVYKLQISASTNTAYINRSRLSTPVTTSSITVMELSA